jgi:hypothetical protein
MRIACWITKATDTRSEYVILIAFQLQQWLSEHTSILRLYINCLSCFTPSWRPTAAMLVPLSNVSNNSAISNRNHFTFSHNFSLFFRTCKTFSKHNYSTRVTNCSKECKKNTVEVSHCILYRQARQMCSACVLLRKRYSGQ